MNIFDLFNPNKPPTKIFTFKDIPVFVTPWWCIMIAVFFLLTLPNGFVPAITIVGFLVMAYSFVIVHEFGHALTAAHYGIRCPHIHLYPFAGLASLDLKRRMPPMQEFWITLNGPATNFAWVVLFYPTISIHPFFMYPFTINLMLLLFNLIPVCPMDGGRLLRALLQMWMDHLRATKAAYYTGLFVGLPIALLAFLNGWYFMGIILAMMAIFVGRQELKYAEALDTDERQTGGLREGGHYTQETVDANKNRNEASRAVDDLLRRTRKYDRREQ